MRHLFELFRKAKRGTTLRYDADGLQLSITQRLLGSKPDHDKEENEEGVLETAQSNPLSHINQVKLKEPVVLVVEDDPSSLNYIEYVLAKLGINALSARSAEKALYWVKSRRVDAMLIDIDLETSMSGIEFFKQVKGMRQFNDVPKIAVTSLSVKGPKRQLLSGAGFDDHLAKPYTFKNFQKVLSRNLAKD